MTLEPTTEGIVGTATIIGAAVLVLKKIGILKIGKSSETKFCPLHNQLTDLVDTIKTTQTLNCRRHEQHEKELEEGKTTFHEIREEIASLRIGVGVLLDRTGGRPDDFRRNK